MTKEWKAGDFAMIKIIHIHEDGLVDLGRADGETWSKSRINTSYLHPLPPAMTDAEKALVEACVAEMPEWSTGFGGTVSRLHPVYDLTQAVLRERAPPDPWRALEQAISQVESSDLRARIRDALDAAKGAKS